MRTQTFKSKVRAINEIASASRFAPTAQEEAEKINAQTGADYVTDQAFWEKQGIFTGEELALSVLGQTYSDMYKELHGFRPRGWRGVETIEKLQAAIDSLDKEFEEMLVQQEIDDKIAAEYEADRQEIAELMPDEYDYDTSPKSSGMGRRMESRTHITVKELKSIINEAIDGHPYDGPIEDWASIASNKWGHGSVVDPQGWKDNCKLGGKFTKGKAPSVLSPQKFKMTETSLRDIIRNILLKEYGGRPYDPTAPGDYERYRDNPTGDAPPGGEFDAKLEKMADEIGDRAAGGYEPSIDGSPEAYADMILDVYLEDPPPPLDQMEDLEFVLTKPMYREQVKNAVLEYIGMMTESISYGLQEGVDPRGLKTLLKNLGVTKAFRGVSEALSDAFYEWEGDAEDMKEAVEGYHGGYRDDSGQAIDWPLDVYQQLYELYVKQKASYRAPGRY
tara:strand:+ start:2717 stop:4057 length:1341 start_codon:yes stop_codon:yes gene_type:complete